MGYTFVLSNSNSNRLVILVLKCCKSYVRPVCCIVLIDHGVMIKVVGLTDYIALIILMLNITCYLHYNCSVIQCRHLVACQNIRGVCYYRQTRRVR